MTIFVSTVTIDPMQCRKLRITDTYSLHRVVYDLFEDVRGEHNRKSSSGLLFADRTAGKLQKSILIISDREPRKDSNLVIRSEPIPDTFFAHPQYQFTLWCNPVKQNNKKSLALKEPAEILDWLDRKASQNGFSVKKEQVIIADKVLESFPKDNYTVTFHKVKLQGVLQVTDHDLFKQGFAKGIGKGKAFGMGLLQIAPVPTFQL